MKRRITVIGQTYYIPCSADQKDSHRGEMLQRDEVLAALEHLTKCLGTSILPWEVAWKLANLYSGSVGHQDENIARWWRKNFPRETKPYIYCHPYNLYWLATRTDV